MARTASVTALNKCPALPYYPVVVVKFHYQCRFSSEFVFLFFNLVIALFLYDGGGRLEEDKESIDKQVKQLKGGESGSKVG